METLVSTAMQTIPQWDNFASVAYAYPTTRCGHCQLVQFLKETRKTCLRCKRDLAPPPAVLAVESVPAPPIDDGMSFGHRLCLRVKVIRELKAIPQKSLAEAMQVPRSFISKLENLNAVPTLGTLYRLAEALGVPLEQLTDESVPPEQIAMRTWAYGGTDEDLIGELIQALGQLTHRQRYILAEETKALQRGQAAA